MCVYQVALKVLHGKDCFDKEIAHRGACKHGHSGGCTNCEQIDTLDSQYVVPLIRCHARVAAPSSNQNIFLSSSFEIGNKIDEFENCCENHCWCCAVASSEENTPCVGHRTSSALEQSDYVLVMPLGECSLHEVCHWLLRGTKDRFVWGVKMACRSDFAGRDVLLIQQRAAQVAQTIAYLHNSGIIHGAIN